METNLKPVFEIAGSKVIGDLPVQCRDVIKQSKEFGMFDAKTIYKQENITIYFVLTQACNLRCNYCYQPKEFRKSDSALSLKVAEDTMDFVIKSFDLSRIKFSLFGGEPFLNPDVLMHLVKEYPMFPFVVTTNGLVLLENKEVRDFVLSHRNNLKLSVSIHALKQKYGKDYLRIAKPVLDAVCSNGGDVHYVIDDPTPEALDEIMYLYNYPIPVVRISAARHWDKVKEKNQEYIELFKKVADYLYFGEKPMFGRSQWDVAFKNNIYAYYKGQPLKSHPPTFCGCGYLYLAVDRFGDMYPCDFFANFPEFKIGNIYTGFNDTSVFFKKMGTWIEDLYESCRDCAVCPEKDIRLCPRAMCLAENYIVSGNPLKPAPNHCWANRIEFNNYAYIAQRAIKEGIDVIYNRGPR